jgi:hypothetical protein
VESAGEPSPAAVPEPGLLEQAGLLWEELRGLAHDQFKLLALEARQACSRFALIVALALAAAALTATAWLGLIAAGVFWMIELGVSPAGALLAAVCANLAAAVACLLLLQREVRELPFASSLRSIRGR